MEQEPVGWRLPPAQLHERTDISGGTRTLHELAVALAAGGREVELRGPVSRPVLESLTGAAGARPDLPERERRPGSGEIVVLPEGGYDFARHARVILSPARLVVVLLAPTGQFGWPFVEPWEQSDPLEVEIASLCRPEHFQAMAALGIELWTHMGLARDRAVAAGAQCHFIGNGDPCPAPSVPEVKDIPVAYMQANRWRALAEEAASHLEVPVRAIPPGDHDSVMTELARSQILLWPARVEGDGRLLREARARGTVVLGLSSNIFATGLEPSSGAIGVQTLEQMATEAKRLLGERDELRMLSGRGPGSVAEQVDWSRYVLRVDQAASATETRPAQPADSALAAFGERIDLLVGESTKALRRVGELDRLLADAKSRLALVDHDFGAARAELEAFRQSLRVDPAHHIPTKVLLGELGRRLSRRLARGRRGER